jgi:mono/diheme cytochrome c family protein
MEMKNIVKTTALVFGVLLSTNTIVVANETKSVDIANGAQLWADTCMRCHNVRPPSDLTIRAWSYSMNHMRVRAGLTGQETRDILGFIVESKTGNDKE